MGNSNRQIDGVVYMTINCINGRRYIGRDRYTRKSYLGGGRYIKEAIKKYGKRNFIRIILRRCSTLDDLMFWEQHYIDLYQASKNKRFYNISGSSRGGGDPLNKHKRIPVFAYDMNGFLVKEYESFQAAADSLGVCSQSIHKVVEGKLKTSCGYFWSLECKRRIDFCPPKTLKSYVDNTRKPVYYYDEKGGYLGGFSSLRQAQNCLGIDSDSIKDSCANMSYAPYKKYKYIFSYNKCDKIIVNPHKYPHFKAVLKYSVDGVFIKEYISIADAAKDHGVTYNAIHNALSGFRKKGAGFIWKYKQDAA
jgi:hypothetical protein